MYVEIRFDIAHDILCANKVTDILSCTFPRYGGLLVKFSLSTGVPLFNTLVRVARLNSGLQNLTSRYKRHHSMVWCAAVWYLKQFGRESRCGLLQKFNKWFLVHRFISGKMFTNIRSLVSTWSC